MKMIEKLNVNEITGKFQIINESGTMAGDNTNPSFIKLAEKINEIIEDMNMQKLIDKAIQS